MLSFNLTTSPFIYCADLNQQLKCLSLIETFQQAHNLYALEDSNPLTLMALYRLLLAILHRAYRGPQNEAAWANLWEQGQFNEEIPAYLTQWQDRFDLFSATHPFYQTADFKTQSPALPISKLKHELTSANNKTLFDHSLDDAIMPLDPATAARDLIATQAYALGGGKGATSNLGEHSYLGHAPLIGGVMTWVTGQTLFETLLLNTLFYDCTQNKPIPCNHKTEDCPLWEHDAPPKLQKTARSPNGYLDYLTWYSRHIRLLPETHDGQITVSKVYISQGNGFILNDDTEPFRAYKSSKDGYISVRLSLERALWRDSANLFIFGESEQANKRPHNLEQLAYLIDEGDLPEIATSCMVIGFANDKANPLAWRLEELPISNALLTQKYIPQYLKKALQWAEKIGFMLRMDVRQLVERLLTNGQRKADAKMVSNFAASLGTEAKFWAALELQFKEYMQKIASNQDLDTHLADWNQRVARLAIHIFESTTRNCLKMSSRELKARVQITNDFKGKVYGTLKKLLPEAAT